MQQTWFTIAQQAAQWMLPLLAVCLYVQRTYSFSDDEQLVFNVSSDPAYDIFSDKATLQTVIAEIVAKGVAP